MTAPGLRSCALLLCLLAAALPAGAQQRPTLQGVEDQVDTLDQSVQDLDTTVDGLGTTVDGLGTSVDAVTTEQQRLVDALCSYAAILDGPNFRPFVCEPQNLCGAPDIFGESTTPPAVVTCTESVAEEVVLQATRDFGSCDGGDHCFSTLCFDEGSHDPCDTLTLPCSAGEECYSPNPFSTGGSCRKSCTTHSECSGADSVCGASSFAACTTGSCAEGESCITGQCIRRCVLGCQDVEQETMQGPVGIDSPGPVNCFDANVVNGNDALLTLDGITAYYGISCSFLCGNGLLQPGEQCDDGNTTAGDGCDAGCQLEP